MIPFMKSRVAIVSGATGSVAHQTCLLLARAGAEVVALGDDQNTLNKIEQQICSEGGRVRVSEVDPTTDAVEGLIKSTHADHGRLDVLLCFSGTVGGIGNPVTDTPLSTFQADLAATVVPAFNLIHHAAPFLRRTPNARIGLMSSPASLRPQQNCASFAAATAAINQLVQNLSVELRPAGISVNAFAPGAILTDGSSQLSDTVMFGGGDFSPQPPELAAHLPLWMCSPEADGITGEYLQFGAPNVDAAIEAFRATHHMDFPTPSSRAAVTV